MSDALAVWADGHLSESADVSVDVSDRGFLLGDGLFETIAVFNGKAHKLDAHLDRLSEAAVLLGLFIEKSRLRQAVEGVIESQNNVHGIVRLTVTRGTGGRGLAPPLNPKPAIFAVLMPWATNLAFDRVRLATSTIRRNDRSPVTRVKSLGYLDNILALREVTKLGADDALFLNTSGRVCCTTISNLFLLTDNCLITPPVFEGVLPGIMRNLVLATARAVDFPCEEQPITRDMLDKADLIFLTNSIRFIRQVTELDRASTGNQALEVMKHLSLSVLEDARSECGGLPGDLETTRQSLSATLHINDAAG